MTKIDIINQYNRLAYTHSYIFGYAVKGIVYGAVIADASELLDSLTYTDRASSKNGGTLSLKYRQNSERIEIINTHATEIKEVCTEEYLETLKATTKHNRGQIFEELVATVFGGVQNTKVNAKFTTDGDVEIDGIAYQVKYNKCTFTDERTLNNLTR